MLAILAGVGSVAYRGYIKKANEAADLELLSAVNTAFQAACTEEGQNPYPVMAAVGLKENKAVDTVSYGASKPNETELTDTFNKYFKGNEDHVFKTYEGLEYVGNGVFAGVMDGGSTIVLANGMKMSVKDNEDGTRTFTFTDEDGKELSYSMNKESLESYRASTFGQSMKASELMGEIDKVSSAFQNFLNGMPMFASKLDWGGLTDGLDPGDPDYNKKLGNAMVNLVARASTDGSFDAKGYAEKWRDSGITAQLNPGSLNETAAQLALGYGLVTGFVNSEYGDQTYQDGMTYKEYFQQQVSSWDGLSGMQSLQGVTGLLSSMSNSQAYKDYYDSKGESDVDAYLAALGYIKDNESTLLDGNQVVGKTEGYADEDLGQILDAIFGGE